MSKPTGLQIELRELGALSPSGYFIGLHIRMAVPLMTFQTYPQEWRDHYTEAAYALSDPILAWGFGPTGTARWSNLGIPDPFGILEAGSTFGLRYGVAVSYGPISSRTIAGSARDDREFTDDEMERIETIVRRLHEATIPPESLTKAQIDALTRIAAGDRHAQAAAALGISESALKARLTSARQKLLARTTAEAIQRAKDYRLL